MPIALRGTAKGGGNTAGADVTLTFDTGGSAPQIGDVAVLMGGHSYSNPATDPVGPITAGYTEVNSYTDVNGPWFGCWYKRFTTTPDLTVVCYGSNIAGDAAAYAVAVFSGVDSRVLDTAGVEAGPDAQVPDPPAITTVTRLAWVVCGAVCNVVDTTRGTQANYTQLAGASANDTRDLSCQMSYREIASPATENPPAWSSWASGTALRATIALRARTSIPVELLRLARNTLLRR